MRSGKISELHFQVPDINDTIVCELPKAIIIVSWRWCCSRYLAKDGAVQKQKLGRGERELISKVYAAQAGSFCQASASVCTYTSRSGQWMYMWMYYYISNEAIHNLANAALLWLRHYSQILHSLDL